MKRATLLSVPLLLTVALTAWAGATQAPLSTAVLRNAITAGKKNTVVFFQNPMGGPCRAQNEILQKLLKDRKGGFTIAPVSTLNPDDQKAFYDYGVRSLPTIVIVDKKGNIANYFPPGIQSYDAISSALGALK